MNSDRPLVYQDQAPLTERLSPLVGDCPTFVFRNGFERGQLSQVDGPGTPITYLTHGGFTIKVDRHTITVTDPWGMNTTEHWGDPHENLNGKHIKDWGGSTGWDGQQRSIVLADGAKVTMTSPGAHGVVLATSIYDGDQNLQIDNAGNIIEHHGNDAADTRSRDDAQHDGETALFETDPVTGSATYSNIYVEDSSFSTTPVDVPLGTTGGCANPNQVNDLFDDPRLAHT